MNIEFLARLQGAKLCARTETFLLPAFPVRCFPLWRGTRSERACERRRDGPQKPSVRWPLLLWLRLTQSQAVREFSGSGVMH